MFKIGVSFGSAIQRAEHLNDVLRWRADVVEFPLSWQAPTLAQTVAGWGCLSALHIPSGELIERAPFILNMQTPGQVDEYLCMIGMILQHTERHWEYLVAHYPLLTKLTDRDAVRTLNERYIDGVRQLCRRHGLRLLIENVAVHPFCYLPEDYQCILGPEEGLCFDIGHAHTLDAVLFHRTRRRDYVGDFFRLLGKRIACIHLYNTTDRLSGPYDFRLHYPLSDADQSADGFMDLPTLQRRIFDLPGLDYVIHEPHRSLMVPHAACVFGPFGGYLEAESDWGHVAGPRSRNP